MCSNVRLNSTQISTGILLNKVKNITLSKPADAVYGFSIVLNEDIGHYIIKDVAKDSISEKSGLKVGDIIVKINKTVLIDTCLGEIIKILRESRNMLHVVVLDEEKILEGSIENKKNRRGADSENQSRRTLTSGTDGKKKKFCLLRRFSQGRRDQYPNYECYTNECDVFTNSDSISSVESAETTVIKIKPQQNYVVQNQTIDTPIHTSIAQKLERQPSNQKIAKQSITPVEPPDDQIRTVEYKLRNIQLKSGSSCNNFSQGIIPKPKEIINFNQNNFKSKDNEVVIEIENPQRNSKINKFSNGKYFEPSRVKTLETGMSFGDKVKIFRDL